MEADYTMVTCLCIGIVACSVLLGVVVDAWHDDIKMLCGEDDERDS